MKFLIIPLITGLISASYDAEAGEFRISQISGCDYEFVGSVKSGDASKLEEVSKYYKPVVLCFESSGGDLRAGLEMFEIIWNGNINTKVLDGKICASACAIAFLAGGDTQGTDVTRQVARAIEPGAVLKFHSPRLSREGLRDELIQLDAFQVPAYERAMQTAADLFSLSQKSHRGVNTITEFTLWQILQTRYHEWYEVNTIGDAVLSKIDLIVPLDLKINSDSQIFNICDNFHASSPWEDLPKAMAKTAKEQYTKSAGAKITEQVSDYPIIVGKDEYGAIRIRGMPYFSGSKYGWVECVIEITPPIPIDEINHYGDPIYTSHRDTRIRAALVFLSYHDENFNFYEVPLQEVPIWYIFSPDTKISEIRR